MVFNTFNFNRYFPHFFNKKENQKYIGSYPDKDCYGFRHFTKEKQKDFNAWYDSVQNRTFNFVEELFSYCEIDVELLAKGCIAFTKIIEKASNISPFSNCITLASLCHKIFRQNYMIPESIAIIPEVGYNPKQKASKKALLWIKWCSSKKNIKLSHAMNGFEKKIEKFQLDGWDSASGEAYEFHGIINISFFFIKMK